MSKTLKIAIISLLSLTLLVTTFAGGLMLGWSLPGSPQVDLPNLQDSINSLISPAQSAVGETTPTAPVDREELFKPFWEVWDIVKNQYVAQPVDETAMMRGAIRGMLESLGDEHTSYMDPEMFQQQNNSLQGYEGIGAWVDITGEYLKIISPMPNSPAERAGLKAEDTVIAVNGEDMTGVDGNLVLDRILGPAGTEVTLTILREGQEPFDVTIRREQIKVPSVEVKQLDDQIAYVQFFTYGEDSARQLKDALKEVMKDKPRGLILDLRNNGGGYLTTAIDVVSEFVPGNQLAMVEEFGDGSRRTFKTKNGGLATEIPLVVLVNEGTASASEITAGAIQDYNRGKLVGVTTFGKGSVQNWITLADDQGGVRVTIARWLTPKERQINKVGLEPDVTVEITEEDIKAGKDPQLDKAIEVLGEMIQP